MKPNVKFLLSCCLLSTLLILSSCLDTPDGANDYEQLTKEVIAIDTWISTYQAAGGKVLANDVRGVRMIVSEFGDKLPTRSTDKVGYLYQGWLFDPTVPSGKGASFDAGYLESNLNTLIQGWRIAFSHLPVGSKATLLIPSYWGYGSTGSNSIPKNATLLFEIEIKEVFPTTAELNQLKLDTIAIKAYLDTKEITNYERDSLGVYYVHQTVGNTGRSPMWFDKVTFNYNYKLLSEDNKIVSEGNQAPVSNFNSWITDYVQGFTIALTKMRPGGKATFYIPSLYCFGAAGLKTDAGATIVGANAPIILEIELTKVE
jgi:FKBP-type peptidyl-prolyl cis-trans isomerase